MHGDANIGRCAAETEQGKQCRNQRILFSLHCDEHQQDRPRREPHSGTLIALLKEARDLFRSYEAHHRAKIDEAGRPEKAERNKDIADRIDAALGEGGGA